MFCVIPMSSGLFSLLKFLSKIGNEKCELGGLIVFLVRLNLFLWDKEIVFSSILNG